MGSASIDIILKRLQDLSNWLAKPSKRQKVRSILPQVVVIDRDLKLLSTDSERDAVFRQYGEILESAEYKLILEQALEWTHQRTERRRSKLGKLKPRVPVFRRKTASKAQATIPPLASESLEKMDQEIQTYFKRPINERLLVEMKIAKHETASFPWQVRLPGSYGTAQ